MSKVSWNELKIGECFTGPGGLYKKVSKDVVFYFNGHTEIDVGKKYRNNKGYVRTERNE
jgi:hypothetical protein